MRDACLWSVQNNRSAYSHEVHCMWLASQTVPFKCSQKRQELETVAERRTTILTWVGLGLMSVQFGILARLTWWEYSWDIMEPVTYFVTYGTAMAAYAYYVVTKQVTWQWDVASNRLGSNISSQVDQFVLTSLRYCVCNWYNAHWKGGSWLCTLCNLLVVECQKAWILVSNSEQFYFCVV